LVVHESGGLGARLRTARLGFGLTQKQLAEELRVESITVSRWERGVTTPSLPRPAELAALREELAETRQLVDRVARALERLARPRSVVGSAQASRDS
jgi:transcriptional regulator with XRE-family HTH domain